MKRMSLILLCTFAIAGCKEKTLEELQAEIAEKEAVRLADERAGARTLQIPGYNPIRLTTVCIGGVQYYTAGVGHAIILTPALHGVTGGIQMCKG